MDELILSVVDQSPVRSDGTAKDALNETVDLAIAAESLGYRRYWVAEHHNLANFAGTSPEIMVGQIASRTNTIRVGSGGVMLPHYSALKVAENFRMLETLFPGRIDLGIGRAPGSDQITAAALAYPRVPIDITHYPEQVKDVMSFLGETHENEHMFNSVFAGPGKFTIPDIWLLGSRIDSAALAAEMGLPYSYAHFFGTSVELGPKIVEMYRKNFKPSVYLDRPYVNVGVQVICSDTEEEAQNIALSRNLSRVKSVQGIREGLSTIEEAKKYQYRPNEVAYLESLKANYVDGNPLQVKEGLETIASEYQTNDLSIVTICYDFADRLKSYELISDVCRLV